MKKKLTIAVHNAKFHADDVFSVVILKKVLGDIEVIRTRDEKLLKKADFRVDVGDKYNHETKDYDHHQENSPVRENGILYSSCGLIWKHYGENLVNSKEAFEYIDNKLIEFIDAGDNGIDIEKSERSSISIMDAINEFNSNWDEESSNEECFDDAVDFAFLFFDRILAKANALSKGQVLVDKCLNEMKDSIIVLPFGGLPKKNIIESEAMFWVHSSSNNSWVSVAVPIKEKSFIRKIYFPDSWAGLLNEELEKVSGVKDLTFCHKHKFIIAGKTKESVLEATKIALNTKG